MSTTTCNVRGKQEGLMQKVGPMKATIPVATMSSLLRPLNNSGGSIITTSNQLFSTMSPDHSSSSGYRSPGAINYYKGIVRCFAIHIFPLGEEKNLPPFKDCTKIDIRFAGIPHLLYNAPLSSCIRRTASLDALYMKPSWKIANQLQLQQQSATYTILQLDKATQTDESCISSADLLNYNVNLAISDNGDHSNSINKSCGHINTSDSMLNAADTIKSDKIFRQRLQRVQRSCEHSVSSQTLSPIHSK